MAHLTIAQNSLWGEQKVTVGEPISPSPQIFQPRLTEHLCPLPSSSPSQLLRSPGDNRHGPASQHLSSSGPGVLKAEGSVPRPTEQPLNEQSSRGPLDAPNLAIASRAKGLHPCEQCHIYNPNGYRQAPLAPTTPFLLTPLFFPSPTPFPQCPPAHLWGDRGVRGWGQGEQAVV